MPLDDAVRYVAAAYIVFVTLILVYVAIMGLKLSRIERRLDGRERDRAEPRQ